MDIVGSFADLLQVFAVTMTPATQKNMLELFTGWVFAPNRTITGMLRAAGTDRHHSAPARQSVQSDPGSAAVLFSPRDHRSPDVADYQRRQLRARHGLIHDNRIPEGLFYDYRTCCRIDLSNLVSGPDCPAGAAGCFLSHRDLR